MDFTQFNRLANRFSAQHILVIGDVMLDRYLWGRVDRISPEAPVPVVTVERSTHCAGGAGNAARNLAGLGARVSIIGITGQDDAAHQLKNDFQTDNIDIRGLIRDPERTTTIKTRVIAGDQQVVRVYEENCAPPDKKLEKRILANFQDVVGEISGIVIEDYNKGLLTRNLVKQILEISHAHSVPVYVDPKIDNIQIYQRVRLMKPNKVEFLRAIHTETADPDELIEMGKKFREKMRTDILLVTLGSEGMLVFSAKNVERIKTHARRVHDVSGAGDTVISTFALADLAGAEIKEAAFLANTAAGRVCEEVGVVPVTNTMLTEIIRHQLG